MQRVPAALWLVGLSELWLVLDSKASNWLSVHECELGEEPALSSGFKVCRSKVVMDSREAGRLHCCGRGVQGNRSEQENELLCCFCCSDESLLSHDGLQTLDCRRRKVWTERLGLFTFCTLNKPRLKLNVNSNMVRAAGSGMSWPLRGHVTFPVAGLI